MGRCHRWSVPQSITPLGYCPLSGWFGQPGRRTSPSEMLVVTWAFASGSASGRLGRRARRRRRLRGCGCQRGSEDEGVEVDVPTGPGRRWSPTSGAGPASRDGGQLVRAEDRLAVGLPRAGERDGGVAVAAIVRLETEQPMGCHKGERPAGRSRGEGDALTGEAPGMGRRATTGRCPSRSPRWGTAR